MGVWYNNIKMIKRNRRNIGKLVKIDIPESAKPTSFGKVLHGRIGKVVGFRGNIITKSETIPYVQVLVKNIHNDNYSGSYTIPGGYLIRL